MSETNNLSLKAIGDINSVKFIIPTYQRGYRWRECHVHQLLVDITTSMKKNDGKNPYLLQPLTLKDLRNNSYEVIDGQQRLISIWIIKHYFEKIMGKDDGCKQYSFEYNSKGSQKFLENLGDEKATECCNTIDEEHFALAYKTVKKYFETEFAEKKDPHKGNDHARYEWLYYLEKKVMVIWYVVDSSLSGMSGEKIFMELNRGRIPLGNSELIKAILLAYVGEGYPNDMIINRQLEISTQWDIMEQELQNSDFWAFVAGAEETNGRPRLDYFFELLPCKNKKQLEYCSLDIEHGIFNMYADWITEWRSSTQEKSKADFVLKYIWQKHILESYLKLREWYEDIRLYHKIGFLIAINGAINERLKRINLLQELLSKDCTKAKFMNDIDDLIRETIVPQRSNEEKRRKECIDFDIENLSFSVDSDKKKIETVLFLHNVISCMNSGLEMNNGKAERYSFAQHLNEEWTLEHINPQKEARLNEDKSKDDEQAWRNWLEEHKQYLDIIPKSDPQDTRKNEEWESFNDTLEKVIDKKIPLTGILFKELHEKMLLYFNADFNETTEHHIGNLALISHSQNSTLGASIFWGKRLKILNFITKGKFVPYCTKWIFMKFYSELEQEKKSDVRALSFAFWTLADARDYCNNIHKVLDKYLAIDSEE